MRMTEKQQIFADEYLKDLNGTRAYKVAYPNVKKDSVAAANATRLLRNAKVKTYIDKQLEKMHNERTADAQEVLEYLTAVMRGEYKEATLIGVGEGAQAVVDIDVGAKDRLKAAELLGKRHALFTDKVDLQTGDIVIKVGEWDADEET
ncbi:terminase small subunit [Enterococcus faecalis]|uniref:terminase small subunit n=2 Tax=Enterococcus faecalis TaxID=1351 RepID=UPI000C12C04A|nr:terminase small subunit [Enterococcus faecalis]EGO2799410.1 terminase small subunit [Enterococcus faecalis]EJB2751351.1 terminase small subunit [Enterococcus faecalis]MCU9781304.1 terminase small subunit [Enterococcus faecalis]MCU9795776.1 terminase small subunit [Enterococcus faecalis]HBI1962466.1 terminase small subunit [Enterococcus faecalis]